MPGIRYTQRFLLSLLAALGLCACGDSGSDQGDPAEAAPSIRATDVTVAPAQPAPPAEPASPAPESPPSRLTPDLHARFSRGLSLEEARALIAVPALRVGASEGHTEIYRWTDAQGLSFTARFDDGLLSTKSNLVAPRTQDAPPPPPGDVLDLDNMPVAQIAPGVYIPLERAVTAATEQPLGASEPPQSAPPAEVPAAPPAPAAKPEGPTIAIAGAARREREAREKASSYNPHADLPDFSRSLDEGSFEIRLFNPSDSPMTAGLRQDKLGKDIAIPPKAHGSIKVNRGVYQLYFLRESDPDTLFEAPSLTIDGFQTTDVEVHLDPDNVQVRLIDYSKPG